MSARSIDKLTVVEAYPGCWSVDAEGIRINAPTAADAITVVQSALLGDGGSK